MVRLFYTTYISVDLAHHEIFRAKVSKVGIIFVADTRARPQTFGNQGQSLSDSTE